MIVVDASVAVKWFLRENHSDNAITLLTLDRKLVAPTVAIYEVTGAFVRALRRNDIDLEIAVESRDRWLNTVRTNVLRLESDSRDIVRATEIASTLEHAFADCVYLAMAERLDTPLVTADSVLFEKANKATDRVVHISNVLDLCPAIATSN